MNTGVQPALAPQLLPFSPWPHFGQDEIEAAVAVLRSGRVNYWTGDEGRQFEAEFARSVGVKHAVCVANGTLALELALQALGVGPGDEVITTSRTFIASASCAIARGARVLFADVDRDSQNITARTIRHAISRNTKAIVAVHLAGWPCDMEPIMDMAADFDLKVIEDCAQAQGALYQGSPVGSIGHMAAFSFCQDKIMTTGGEGGMVTTNDEDLWVRAWSYKDHGKSYEAVHHREHPPGFRWLHDSFGSNWRLTEMQSAMGRRMLPKVAGWVETRRHHADMLARCFRTLPGLRVTEAPSSIRHAYYKYYAFVRPERLRAGWNRDRIAAEITACGVPCFSGSCSEIYLERAFPRDMRPKRPLTVAHELGQSSLMFLVHPTLTEQHIDLTCKTVETVMNHATA
jgi:dTDP-4-amino-4,6-dideoxygalactose transaminase